MTIIGIDNGPSGSIAAINGGKVIHYDDTPTYLKRNYTKKEGYHHALDRVPFRAIINNMALDCYCVVYMERPYTGTFVKTAAYALAFHVLIESVLNDIGITLHVIDSKDWQLPMLGKVPAKQTKQASMKKGIELYPKLAKEIRDRGDADALLIAHYYYQEHLKNRAE